MSQYKAAMTRMMREESAGDGDDVEGINATDVQTVNLPSWAQLLKDQSDFLLRAALPVLWTCLFVILMDRDSFVRFLFMPVLGVFAALLANCVPIGGGIVYVPILALLGQQMNLSVSFAVATMTVGNGILGFLQWLRKDPSLIVFESFPHTVFPCSLGSAVGILFLPQSNAWAKMIFGVFSVLVGVYVLLLAYNHVDGAAGAGGGGKSSSPQSEQQPSPNWLMIQVALFLSGLVLVTNIGVGPALVSFVLLENAGYSHKQSMVTGIVTGGWVSLVPFLLHLFVTPAGVPLQLWVMVLPGVYVGAMLAPKVYERVGLRSVLASFSFFLFASAALFLI